MLKYVLAIDQGTTSSRAILFDKQGHKVAMASREVKCLYPNEGYVEEDAMEIWISVVDVCNEVLIKSNTTWNQIDSIGITNQRETTVVWDKETGQPIYKAFGTDMYAVTLGAGFMPDFVEDLGFYSFSKHTMAKEGVLCDIYLTDGTVIHGAVCDGIGKGHSNTVGKCNGWTASSKATAQDHTRYKLSPLKHKQYRYFVHSAVCHTVEFFGDGNKFMKYFDIAGDGSGNAISFIRLYAASLADSDVTVKDKYSNLVTRN